MKKNLAFAFKRSLPVLMGYGPLGLACGILMKTAGYNFIWMGACSLFVYAGSLQFLMVEMLTGTMPLVTVAVMAFLLNSRHIFYGLTFLEKFQSFGKGKNFLIWTLTDECFSLHCAYKPEEGIDEKTAFIMTAALCYSYWIVFTILGSLIGSLITFDTTGMDFAMTALFIVILVEQLQSAKSRIPAVIAFASSLVCLLVIGADQFILPSLLITIIVLVLIRAKVEPEEISNVDAMESKSLSGEMNSVDGRTITAAEQEVSDES